MFMKTPKAFQHLLINIGQRLAELRVKKGYATIKDFAAKYGLPEIQYWRMERGKANLTLKSLVRVLVIHNISVQEFFCLVSDEKLAA
jgi:transcriptional regulator with XRE-family HTH domain